MKCEKGNVKREAQFELHYRDSNIWIEPAIERHQKPGDFEPC